MPYMKKLALVMPIRSTKLFLKKTIGAVEDLVREWETAYSDPRINELDYELRPVLEAVMGSYRPWFDLRLEGRVFERVKYTLSSLKELSKAPYDTWLFDYVRDLQDIQEVLAKHVPAFSKVTPRSLARAAEEEGVLWDAEYEEGIPPDVLRAPADLGVTLNQAHKILAIQLVRYEATRSKDVKPEKVETLYHASANAKSLYSSGFSSSVPDEAELMGLGGSQADKAGNRAISMTYDLKGALGIARVYKELAMVYTGEVKAVHILDWVRRGGDPKHFRSFLHTEWRSFEYTFEFEGGKWRLFEWDVATQTRTYTHPDKVFSTPKDRVKLYKAYLTTTKSRFNPFFMHIHGTARHLAKRPDGIGVLAIEVDMTHPDISYYPGEKEFRIPPAAVIRIKKFLR